MSGTLLIVLPLMLIFTIKKACQQFLSERITVKTGSAFAQRQKQVAIGLKYFLLLNSAGFNE
jgi:hypothetical protein